ncbi:F-box protein SKIP5, partial [Zea mays]
PITPFFIAAGGSHVACNIQINKPICIVSFAFHIGGGNLPDDTVLTCSRGFDK